MEEDSWLDSEAGEAARTGNQQKSLEVSQLYTVFEIDPRCKQLLALWDEGCLRKRTPVNATHAQYAADEAIRAFVAGIHAQIAIARKAETK